MRNRAFLLNSVALVGLLTGSTAYAAEAVAVDAPAEDIVVFGRGQTRQVQELRKADITAAVPGTSPLKVLDKLPSVSFQSANALGTNEWSTRISVRGFTQSQLGFTLDGVPLGDMSYANFNGLHISRAIVSDNIGRVELSQGSGALDTASSSNLGGTIRFFSIDPADTLGVETSATYGSDDNWRVFARLESGDLGGGVKGYVSGSYLDAPKWKGKGKQEAWTINSKLVVPLSERGKISAIVDYSNQKDDDYMDVSPSIIKRYGWNHDYLRYDYAQAVSIAQTYQANPGGDCNGNAYAGGYTCVDDTYYDGYGLRKDLLASATLDYDLTDDLAVKLTPYYHRDRGIGTWWTPYTATPGGGPLSVRSTAYAINRGGLTGSATYKIANHTLEASGWYEKNKYKLTREFFGLDAGNVSSIGPREWPEDPFFVQYQYKFNINTYQFAVQDTWQLTEAFKINAGFKGLQVNVDNTQLQGAASLNTSGKLKAKDMFIPQIGANYMIMEELEAFGSYAENMRAFDTAPFLTNASGFAAIKDNIEPETSKTVEGGFRFHLPKFEGSIAGYHVKFDNRLLAVQNCPIIVGCSSSLSNVGSVTTNGVEVAGTYRIMRALSLYGSYAYTDAKYDQDTFDGNGVFIVATKNKTVIDTPKHLVNGELSYDDGQFIGRVHVAYQSKRFYSYNNDASVSGRALVDLTAGYRFQEGGPLAGLDIQANVTNLFNKDYIATLGENGFTNADPNGTLQSMLVGAPRQVFVTVRKRF
jgi:iron complex outermembrane receptor protein